ncbi:hypothetical protein [Rothia aerolata]|uniref:Uncharacterized protein n=1 Tax=Rothia aerolata TaxID=1812262 RepID=A0A917IR03_9MICC|nr:hypothetical protein [Rothia aerolata]GGH59959.1 hypothetical protein GCM10007359_07650 [Rothia aerolata]
MASADFDRSQESPRQRTYDFHAPTEDDPDALSVGGFDDEEEILAEERKAAVAVPNCSFPLAFKRFYSQYWLSKGTASASEFLWGMAWSLGSTIFCFALTLWMGNVVETGGDSVSSLFRVLYMLMAYVAPGWLLVHIGPTFSLLRRYLNLRRAA